MARATRGFRLERMPIVIWVVQLRWGTGATRDAVPRSGKFVDDACAVEVPRNQSRLSVTLGS